jgi:hypothetical protein
MPRLRWPQRQIGDCPSGGNWRTRTFFSFRRQCPELFLSQRASSDKIQEPSEEAEQFQLPTTWYCRCCPRAKIVMNFQPMRRWLPLGMILISTSACDRSSVTQTTGYSERVASDLSAEPAIADYRTWKAINKEPIEIPEARFSLCESSYGPQDPDPNGLHAGGFVNVYVNDLGRATFLNVNSPRFASGSVIVKEKLRTKDATDPLGLGVMIKRQAGYAPGSGDWDFIFVDYTDDNGREVSAPNCVKCHKQMAKHDYVFRTVLMNTH